MPLLVDASNVLLAQGALSPEFAGPSLDDLTRYIAISRFGRDLVWIVCDHHLSTLRSGGIVIEGPGACANADDRIMEILTESSVARRFTVITSDRALATRARRADAHTLASDEFLRSVERDLRAAGTRTRTPVTPTPRALVPLSANQVSRWLKAFALSDEILALQSAAQSPRVNDAAIPTPIAAMLEVTPITDDPFAFLDAPIGDEILDALASLDSASIDALMDRFEPPLPASSKPASKRRRYR